MSDNNVRPELRPTDGGIVNFFHSIHKKHENLKNYVHNRFRYPLPKWGMYMMGCVYFSIPVIGGYLIYLQIDKKVEQNYGKNYEKLIAYKKQHGLEGIGNIRVSDGKKIGLDGWGGGVALVNNDPITEERNRKKLKKYLKWLKHQQYGTTTTTKTDSTKGSTTPISSTTTPGDVPTTTTKTK